MAVVLANSMTCHPRATSHIAGCSHLAKSMSWSCHTAGCNNSMRHIAFRHILFLLFLSRRSRQRERLSGSVMSICLFVCLSVAKMQKNTIFSKTKPFRATVSIDNLYKSYMDFSMNQLLDPLNPRWLRFAITSFFLLKVVRFGKKIADWCRMTCQLRWYGQNRNQI